MRVAIWAAVGVLLQSSIALAGFLPPNDLHLTSPELTSSMSEEQFNAQIDKALAHYAPLVKKLYGATLVANRNWTSETVNAYAYQAGSRWYVAMYGGLARRVSEDGFLAVFCHELGHHLGGYPYTGSYGWAANEGQADFFAFDSCLRNLLGKEDNSAYGAELPAVAKGQCDAAWASQGERDLCYRSMLAAKSLADLLSRGTAAYDTPDPRKVTVTDNGHPAGQCRLDTYMAASGCSARAFDETVIPGKNLGGARNGSLGEKASNKYVCNSFSGDKAGVRPDCWFKSLL